ncbi:hypothetical protein Bhyg_09703 [Pseudolycoriella hygida]|uniref:Uncharacterized protein n=1 Tax=Pseudolycoriella hygida TaxID=35572 RepID=A0A9Q0RY50_9DIPT|nr:hypothetical protein Bhyg_09703 [Pseudolycoriella hygida]
MNKETKGEMVKMENTLFSGCSRELIWRLGYTDRTHVFMFSFIQ